MTRPHRRHSDRPYRPNRPGHPARTEPRDTNRGDAVRNESTPVLDEAREFHATRLSAAGGDEAIQPGTDAAEDPHAHTAPVPASDVPPAPFTVPETVLAAALGDVPGDPPVPISVWRATDTQPDTDGGKQGGWSTDRGSRDWPDHAGRSTTHPRSSDRSTAGRSTGTPSDGSLTPRLAGLLIATYTGVGDTIVDLSTDPALAGAAGAGGRRYLPVTDPADLAGLNHVAGSVGLIVVRWPSPQLAPDPDGVNESDRGAPDAASTVSDLFTACRLLLAANGCTIVVLTPTPRGAPYIDHANVIIPAAIRAGLGYLQHIVAVITPLDRLTYLGPPHQAAPAEPRDDSGIGGSNSPDPSPVRRPATSPLPRDIAGIGHVDLLVFVLRGGRHA
jgi:hypothetical protein